MTPSQAAYRAAGVDTAAEEVALSGALEHLNRTLRLRAGLVGGAVLPNGYFANVLNLGNGTGLAISTDGVGSKVIVAQELGKYDTIGIDCVAMNVNDVLCVGAEPISMVDYLAVERLDPDIMAQIAIGLAAGAELANVTIPGGETAQLPDTVHGSRPDLGFDLVGTCVGTVALDRIIDGTKIQSGDVILGLRSNGIHSNGLTLARKVLFEQSHMRAEDYSPDLGDVVGNVLLEPTRIYVREVLAMLRAGLAITGLFHVTSDGFLNLARVRTPVGFVLEQLPEPQPIFQLIQERGGISDAEMFKTYNMGIGFCVVLAAGDVARAQAIVSEHNVESLVLGYTTFDDRKRVYLVQPKLVGEHKEFFADPAGREAN